MSLSLKRYGALLKTYLRPQWPTVLLLAVLLLSGIGLQLINPQVLRYFLDTAQTTQVQQALVFAAGLFLAIALARHVLVLLSTYLAESIGWSATNALRADLTLHCLRLDMSFHKRRTPGELIERIDGDVTALASFFSQLVVRVLGNALLVLGILLLLSREDWRVGVGLSVYTLVTFFALGAIQRLAVSRWTAARQASAEQFGFLEERIGGTEDVRANGGEAYVMHRLFHLMRTFLERSRAAFLVSHVAYSLTNLLFIIGYAVGLAVGAYLYTQGQVTIGAAFVIVYYIGMLAVPLESIREQVQDLQQASASIDRIEELFRTQPKVKETPRASLPSGALPVAFAGVSFGYDDEATNDERPTTNDNGEPRTENQEPGSHDQALPPVQTGRRPVSTQHSALSTQDFAPSTQHSQRVLHDLSFALPPGTVLGLLGRTGSGKTTITRLLFRLYDPTSGVIRLGDVDLRDVALADLRSHVGMVTQDVQLFQATVRDNLTFFRRNVSDDQIVQALTELGLWGWVQTLPHGLDTKLAAGGQGLSAGEAQLLAFARVFLKDPGLVILDEASSRLDTATEFLLERAIDRLLHPEGTRRTGIIIAHRLRTVQRADQIMILEQGRIVEYGPRQQLASDPASHFYSLLQTGLEEALV